MLVGGIDRSKGSEEVFDSEECFKDKSRVSRVVMNVDGWYENKSRGEKWCLMVMAILRKV